MLSGFEAGGRIDSAAQGLNPYARFADIARANRIADALATEGADALDPTMPAGDRTNVERVRKVASNSNAADWDAWFEALFALARRTFPNGNAAAIEKFLNAPTVVAALRAAPPEIRDRVSFLSRVGARDAERIRSEGAKLLDSPMDINDPGFGLYVLVATATACLASAPDPSCAKVLAKLDLVQRPSPIVDLLRAHRAARG
jgi:hypothetical protein